MDTPLAESQFRALVSLLADRDEAIVRRCKERLLLEQDRARAFLDEAIRGEDIDVATAAGKMLREIRTGAVDRDLGNLAADPALDLESGALAICRLHDPDVDFAPIRSRLDEFAAQVRERVLLKDDPEDVAQGLRSVLAEEAGMRGNVERYDDPENSFLHRVLKRKLGIPISLSVIYLLVSRRAELNVDGIGMPGHFLIRVGDDLFLDPFNLGRSLSRKECLNYLRRAGYHPDSSLLDPTPDRFIVARMLANLRHTYERRNDDENAERMRRLFEAFRRLPRH